MRGSVIAAVLALGAVGFGVASCGKQAAPGAVAVAKWPAKLNVVVSIPPLKGLIEPLLPPGSTVTVLIPPGRSEHGYEIPPGDVLKAINADLLVWVGGMEPSVDTLSRENARATRGDVRLSDALGIEVEHNDHDHDKGGGEAGHEGHDHGPSHGGEGDPHVWLDPQQAVLIVKAVGARVAAARPSGGASAALEAQIARLNALDKEYREGLSGAKAKTIVVGHDAYGWLAKRYGLTTVAISGLSASEPSPADLQKAKEAVRANGLKAVFSEPQLDPAAAKSIAEATGVEVRVLDPLGDGDYFKMMRANLAAIKAALGVGEPSK